MDNLVPETKMLVCAGAQKAATTWLFKCMCEHPMITSTIEKELHFFSDNFNASEIQNHLDKLNELNPGQLPFDCSTSYLTSESAPKNIKSSFPSAKVLIILREPTGRLLSHYNHLRSKGKSDCTNIDECIANYPEIISNGLYYESILRYQNIFDDTQLKIIFYDDIQSNPKKVFQNICNFYGITTYVGKNVDKRYHSSAARSHWLYMWLAIRYRRNHKNFIFKKIFKVMKLIGIDSVFIDNTLARNKKTNDFQEQRTYLYKKYFATDIKMLNTLINVPSSWNTD